MSVQTSFMRCAQSFFDSDRIDVLNVRSLYFYLAVLDGTPDKRLWRGYERRLADTVAYPGFQKHWHTDEFCALIDWHNSIRKSKNL